MGRPVEVLMGDIVSDPKDDPNTSKAANGEEKTPEVGSKNVDFVPHWLHQREPIICRLMEATISLQLAI